MADTCSIVVCGAAGRMGRRIISLARDEQGVEIVGAVEAAGSDKIGRDAGTVAGVDPIGVAIADDYAALAKPGTVTLDFTAAEASMDNARAAASAGAGIVVGTSGLSREQRDEIEKLSASMPTIIAANMSRGINVLLSLVADAVARLGRLRLRNRRDPPQSQEGLAFGHGHSPGGVGLRSRGTGPGRSARYCARGHGR